MEHWTPEQLREYLRTGRKPGQAKAARESKPQPRTATKDPLKPLLNELALLGFPVADREHKFHQARRWRLDAAWPALKIGLEYNGIHGGENVGHSCITNVMRDYEKAAEGQLLGWIILTVTAESVRTGKARVWVERAFALRGYTQEGTNGRKDQNGKAMPRLPAKRIHRAR